METSAASPRVIEPGGGDRFPSLSEIWRHRDLVYYLARREVSGRYKQSAIGVFWAVLQPVLLAVVFSVFLSLRANVPSIPGVPYPVFAVSGMVFWLFISNGLALASGSTVANESLISKVYFPRVIIPLTYLFPALVDLAVAFMVVIAAMLIYGVGFHPQIVLVPLVVLVALGVILGAGLWLSALNVRYRDVHQVIPFLILMGLFVSPIIYPLDIVPESLQPLYALNPVTGLLEAYRWTLFGTTDWPVVVVIIPVVASVLLLVTGAAFFQRAERTFADVI
ncbi:MAG TPA: ABC transporter permease [Solirubrobacterales bacterium]